MRAEPPCCSNIQAIAQVLMQKVCLGSKGLFDAWKGLLSTGTGRQRKAEVSQVHARGEGISIGIGNEGPGLGT